MRRRMLSVHLLSLLVLMDALFYTQMLDSLDVVLQKQNCRSKQDIHQRMRVPLSKSPACLATNQLTLEYGPSAFH